MLKSIGALGLCLGLVFSSNVPARAQGTAFTYQGRLDSGGVPYTGRVEFQFSLWDAASTGSQVASPLTLSGVGVTNGLFAVTLDFGDQFPGADRWLEIAVRTNLLGFTTLSPRQKLTATPYAVTAGKITGTLPASQLSGTVPSANISGSYSGAVTFNNAGNSFSGSFSGDGAGLTNLNAWQLGGNAGTTAGTHFLGTTDNQPVDVRVNNQRVARFQLSGGEPALLGGYSGNILSGSSPGSVIVSGGNASFTNAILSSSYSFVGGGRNNQISAASADSLIVGGANHRVEGAFRASLVGGDDNAIQPNNYGAFLGAGVQNRIHSNSFFAVVVGGQENQIGPSAAASVIGGGRNNRILTNSTHAVLAGGYLNYIGTNATYNFLGGGYQNSVANNVSDAVLGGGRLNSVIASGSFLGGGQQNTISANSPQAVIVGGNQNALGPDADQTLIGGGQFNSISYGTFRSLIAGGYNNTINHDAENAVIGGGSGNSVAVNADYATIPGGRNNTAAAQAFAAGTRARANHTGAFVWADSTEADFASTAANQFLIRASGGVGIGVTSPLRSLHVRDVSGGLGGDIQVGSTSADGTAKLVHFGDVHASGRCYVAIGENGADDRMELTAGTFVFTNLSQSGRVGIGRMPTANKLEVEGDASKTTAGSWLANSDARIKTDIQPVTGALAKLDQVKLISFRYTDDYRAQHPAAEDRRYLNVVAQEFREVFPDHVKSSGEKLPDGSEVLQVDTWPLTIYTAAAVQELHRELRRRDAENAALKARLEKLERLLEAQLNGGAQ